MSVDNKFFKSSVCGAGIGINVDSLPVLSLCCNTWSKSRCACVLRKIHLRDQQKGLQNSNLQAIEELYETGG